MLHLFWQVVATVVVRRARCARLVAGLARARDHRGVVVRAVHDRRRARARPTRPSRPRSTKRSARAGATRSTPTSKPAAAPFEWRRVAAPVRVPSGTGVERVRSIQYVDGDGSRRHRLDVYTRRRRGPGRAGAAADPRRRLGHRQQGSAGPAADVPPRRRAAGCASRSTTASRRRRRGPTTSSTASARSAWVRAHIAEYGGDPDYVVVTGGSAGGHLTALMGLTANDPQFQPGFEDVDTHVRAMVPFYGVYDWTNRFGQRGKHDGLRRVLERIVVKQRYADAPEVFDQASPMSHVNADAPPALDRPRRPRHARAGRRSARVRADAAGDEPIARSSTPSCAARTTRSTCSSRSARCRPIAAVDQFLTWLLTVDPPAAIARSRADAASVNDASAAASDRTIRRPRSVRSHDERRQRRSARAS